MTEEEKHIEDYYSWMFIAVGVIAAIVIAYLAYNQEEIAPATMMPCKYYQGEPFSTPCEHDGKVVR